MRLFYPAVAILAIATFAYGSNRLFYLEAQAVAGYALTGDDSHVYWYSMDQMDVMQKPGLGFDYIQRFSSAGGDWGMLAVQARLAYDSTVKHDVEPQLYNAYLKLKPEFGDIWIGHNKPAFGLASYLDNHGTLLQPLSMYGFGYDRDWGAGYYRDFDWGNLGLSATTGSGMPLYLKGNYIISGRIAKGDLNQQNYTVGFSASHGKNLETMGYHLNPDMPVPYESAMFGFDGFLRYGRWENIFDLLWHRFYHHGPKPRFPKSPTVFFHRASASLFSEGRLKGELQTVWRFVPGETVSVNFGLSYQISSDFTVRSFWDIIETNPKTSVQLYWYHKL